jgi:glycosyltransferase involved in cell wall biosynthesis
MHEYLVSSKIKEWIDKTKIIPAGVECAELDKLYSPNRWKVEKGFQVLCLGRLFGPSYIEYVPWFDYLFKAGMDDVCLTISLSGRLQGPMKNKLKKAGFDFANVGKQFVIFENNPRDNFIRMLRKFTCFICPLSHLDHPTGIFEALYMGVPGILSESDYQQTFFKDYPFVIKPKNKEQLLSTLLWIRENKEEARDKVLPWRDIIREKYNAPKCIRVLADDIETQARKYINNFQTSKGVRDLVASLKGNKYTLNDVCTYINNLASNSNGVVIGDLTRRTSFTYGRSAINHSLRAAGYIDDCTLPTEVFIKRKVFDKSL